MKGNFTCCDCGSVQQRTGSRQVRCAPCKARLHQPRGTHRTCDRCGTSVDRKVWPRDVGGHLLSHCGCRTVAHRNCELCGSEYKVNVARQKHCKQCQPKAAQLLRNKQKEEARRRRGCRHRLHEAHVRAYKEVIVKRMQEQEREFAKVGPPHPSKVSSAVYHRWRIRTNPHALIHMRMRVAIRKALKGGKSGRSWESMVGYSVEQLADHLQRQLPKGTTLADLFGGKLHLDHIVPKSSFDVTKPEELRACWALSNLRPLPAKQNIQKGAKRMTLL